MYMWFKCCAEKYLENFWRYKFLASYPLPGLLKNETFLGTGKPNGNLSVKFPGYFLFPPKVREIFALFLDMPGSITRDRLSKGCAFLNEPPEQHKAHFDYLTLQIVGKCP